MLEVLPKPALGFKFLAELGECVFAFQGARRVVAKIYLAAIFSMLWEI
jgi:hypothetical protein